MTTQKLHPLLRGARAVLFDAGGTLAHPDWERISVLALRETGRPFLAAELQRALYDTFRLTDVRLSQGSVPADHTERPGWMFGDLFLALGIDQEVCDRIRIRIAAAHQQKHIWCSLDEALPALIDQLKDAGMKVGVISNTEDGRLEEVLKLTGICERFDVLVDSYAVGLRKPDAAIFQYALERLGLEPGEAVYVGDSYGHDIVGAQRAGLRAILLDPLEMHADYDCPRIRVLRELTGEIGY